MNYHRFEFLLTTVYECEYEVKRTHGGTSGVETEKFNFPLFEFHFFLFPLRYTSTEFIVYTYHTVILLVDINIIELFPKLCSKIKFIKTF